MEGWTIHQHIWMSKNQVFKKAKDLAAPISEFVLCATPSNPHQGGCSPVLQF